MVDGSTAQANPREFSNIETASWGRRALALVVDWAASTFAVIAIFGTDVWNEPTGLETYYVLFAYIIESAVFTWLLGGSFGKIATGLRVVSHRGGSGLFNPLTLLMRQVLVALVIPPLVFKPDGRGIHDLAAGTATVTKLQFEALRQAQGT